jgi:hypothetical protein
MAKIKISVPFNELIKNSEYRNQIIKMLKVEETFDTLNIQDDHLASLFGPCLEESSDVDQVPHFYVSLKIHDMTLHNVMLYSGASHNMMPKVSMDQLGLDIIKRIVVHGDCEFIINQIKGIYQENHPRLRAYKNIVLSLLEQFPKYNLSMIPRGKNQIVDALATSASVFKLPIFSNKKYDIEFKNKSTVPYNINYWQVFEDDKQIESFLKMEDEFENLNIVEEYFYDEEYAAVFANDG